MVMIRILFSFLLLATPLCMAGQIRVLIIDGFNNHDWVSTTSFLKKELEKFGEFTVDVSTVPKMDSPDHEQWNPDFSEYRVIIQNTTDIGHAEGEWSTLAKKGLEKYISEGGGMYCFHAANNAFPEWIEYNKMIGLGWRSKEFGPSVKIVNGKVSMIPAGKGEGTNHGKKVDATITKLGDHPIHKNMPTTWEAQDIEIYRYARGPAENLHILSYATDPNTQIDFPIEWLTDYGKGHVYCSTYAHSPAQMTCKSYLKILPYSLKWLAGEFDSE